jgi:glycosyltransferase involved in cell wall biosynthesis
MKKKLVYVVNADWYFCLHWMDRAVNFSNNGYAVTVITNKTDQKYINSIRNKGIEVVELDMNRSSVSLIKNFFEFLKLGNILLGIKPDLVNSITVKPNVYIGLLSLLLKFPVVCSVTGLGIIFTSSNLKHRLSKVLVVFFYKLIGSINKSTRFLFENNDDLLEIKQRTGLNDKQLIKVSGAGVDPDIYDFSKVQEKGTSLTILFASRLLKSKGLSYLIDAIDQVNKTEISCQLTIAGIKDGHSDDSYSDSEISEFSHLKNITFLGQVDNVDKLLPSFDVVCLPTFYGEGTPRILIEAAATGRAIITTNTGGCSEICMDGFNGMHVKKMDSESIVHAITFLQSNREKLVEMGFNGRQHFMNCYTNSAVFKEFDIVYSGIMK